MSQIRKKESGVVYSSAAPAAIPSSSDAEEDQEKGRGEVMVFRALETGSADLFRAAAVAHRLSATFAGCGGATAASALPSVEEELCIVDDLVEVEDESRAGERLRAAALYTRLRAEQTGGDGALMDVAAQRALEEELDDGGDVAMDALAQHLENRICLFTRASGLTEVQSSSSSSSSSSSNEESDSWTLLRTFGQESWDTFPAERTINIAYDDGQYKLLLPPDTLA